LAISTVENWAMMMGSPSVASMDVTRVEMTDSQLEYKKVDPLVDQMAECSAAVKGRLKVLNWVAKKEL